MASLTIWLITIQANSVTFELAIQVESRFYNKLNNKVEEVKAAKLILIYISSWVLNYKWGFQVKK